MARAKVRAFLFPHYHIKTKHMQLIAKRMQRVA